MFTRPGTMFAKLGLVSVLVVISVILLTRIDSGLVIL